MSLSTLLGLDQEQIAPKPAVFYRKPGNLFTKRDAALRNCRVLGEKVAQLHFLTKYPTHYCRSGSPLSSEAIFELGLALRSGRRLTEDEMLSLHAAGQAGQVVRVNLHQNIQSFDEKPPTQKEAAGYLQEHFADGAERSWITEYYHRGKGKKAIWTIGDSIHADDFRYVDFDLWANHFKMKPRDLYLAQGPRHSSRSEFTRWIALDVDNHGAEPTVSPAEWLARYSALHELLQSERMPYLAQVNPRNGSYQLWSPVLRWGLDRVARFAERVYSACPWMKEIYPTKSKWAIICPLRPDKVNLLGAGELPKVQCRTKAGKTWSYDLVALWRWHRNPTAIDPDAVRAVLARSFLTSRPSTPATNCRTASAARVLDAEARQMPNQKAKASPPRPKVGRGHFNNLRGQWLELLSDTYLDAVQPPDMAAVAFLTPQLRLFRDGETEKARQFLRDVIEFMRDQRWTFSDRVQNDPDELMRTLDHICRDRLAGNRTPKMVALDAARKRLDDLGFDGSFDSLLWALTTRRNGGRSSGGLDLPVVENEAMTSAACRLMALTKIDHQAALMLLRRILNHVAKNHELGYEFLKGIVTTMGVRLSNYKAQMAFAILTKELIIKTKNYSRCPRWSIATLYDVTEMVQFVRGGEPASDNSGEEKSGRRTGCSSNYTISRFWTNDALYEPLDMTEIAAEVSRLRTGKKFMDRIRASRKRQP